MLSIESVRDAYCLDNNLEAIALIAREASEATDLLQLAQALATEKLVHLPSVSVDLEQMLSIIAYPHTLEIRGDRARVATGAWFSAETGVAAS
ncbi:hypothetical protein [Sinorhizobium psoraleae]|uniref:Uncharacterized protein n=1 Tax=Sinorhizobium psoraleae TaxID=520838 RepID=A0ABT4KK92_9HYPH|nr:hypothetical protein [Sinorhizobium psoraleae]MCZ4092380.1 hypothetical protein [Sinorhizobium psoraleae]